MLYSLHHLLDRFEVATAHKVELLQARQCQFPSPLPGQRRKTIILVSLTKREGVRACKGKSRVDYEVVTQVVVNLGPSACSVSFVTPFSDVWKFYDDFVNPAFKSILHDDDY